MLILEIAAGIVLGFLILANLGLIIGLAVWLLIGLLVLAIGGIVIWWASNNWNDALELGKDILILVGVILIAKDFFKFSGKEYLKLKNYVEKKNPEAWNSITYSLVPLTLVGTLLGFSIAMSREQIITFSEIIILPLLILNFIAVFSKYSQEDLKKWRRSKK